MFKVGDTVVHPSYGVGVVVEIKRLRSLGSGKRYYSIKLLGQPETLVMVPVTKAEKVGLRPPIRQSKLSQIWRVLRADPEALPDKHDERYALLRDKLHGGDVFQVAEALRDLAWRREERDHLTTEGKRLYEEGMGFLVGEIASVQSNDPAAVEDQILRMLRESMRPDTTMLYRNRYPPASAGEL